MPEVRMDSVICVAGRWELEAFDADRTELALFDPLQELIFYKDAEELLLRVTGVDIATVQDRIVISAEAQGEKIDPAWHRLLVDVKAVTLHCFKVEQTPDGWSATVVLDI